MSALFAFAASSWRVMRADFEVIRENRYHVALEATNGVLLNARGKAAGIDPYSLFIGPEVRARAYASEELIEHWYSHPRLTVAAYERQTLEEWDSVS